jgi:hypothetical protein
MRLVTKVLRLHIGNVAVVYLDDIVIYNMTREDCLHHLRMIFESLRKEDLCINLIRCDFFKEEFVITRV